MKFAIAALLATSQAITLKGVEGSGNYIPRAPVGEQAKPVQKFEVPKNHEAEPALKDTIDLQLEKPCTEALEVSEEQLNIELDYFSRNFDIKHYNNAMKIYGELAKEGKHPSLAVHTWELYDAAFSFPRVRRYDLVQQHMDLIQHFEDNLNQNMSNMQHVTNFIRVAKAA